MPFPVFVYSAFHFPYSSSLFSSTLPLLVYQNPLTPAPQHQTENAFKSESLSFKLFILFVSHLDPYYFEKLPCIDTSLKYCHSQFG